jgi:hypothetical protein
MNFKDLMLDSKVLNKAHFDYYYSRMWLVNFYFNGFFYFFLAKDLKFVFKRSLYWTFSRSKSCFSFSIN